MIFGIIVIEFVLVIWYNEVCGQLPKFDNAYLNSSIIVGNEPAGIATDPTTHKVYVANQFSNTISVLDGTADNLLVGVRFNINPNANAGYIKCNNTDIITNQHIELNYNTQCTAIPNKGFQFGRWTQSLGQTQPNEYPHLQYLMIIL